MFNASDNNTLVLIDWGLSYIADSDKKNVPDALSTLSVQPMHPDAFKVHKRVTHRSAKGTNGKSFQTGTCVINIKDA